MWFANETLLLKLIYLCIEWWEYLRYKQICEKSGEVFQSCEFQRCLIKLLWAAKWTILTGKSRVTTHIIEVIHNFFEKSLNIHLPIPLLHFITKEIELKRAVVIAEYEIDLIDGATQHNMLPPDFIDEATQHNMFPPLVKKSSISALYIIQPQHI